MWRKRPSTNSPSPACGGEPQGLTLSIVKVYENNWYTRDCRVMEEAQKTQTHGEGTSYLDEARPNVRQVRERNIQRDEARRTLVCGTSTRDEARPVVRLCVRNIQRDEARQIQGPPEYR